MALYKLIVKNSKVVLKTINAVYLYLTGIKDVAGTGDVANNVVDWSIQHKTKTTAQWTADTTTILLDGQIGVENTGTTTYKFKIGNGVDLWAALGYAGGGSSSGVTSFNSRTGVVTSANGDYTTAQLTISTDKNFVTDDQLVVIGNTSGTNTGDETSARIGAIVNGASNYATPLDADKIGIWDVANSLFKALTWANLKATLKTYFDTLYGLKSYSYTGQFLSVNPADSTSYHFNGNSSTPSTTDTQRSFLFGKAGIIDRVFLGYQQNVNGSGESNTLYLRNITTATDYEVGTFASSFGAATGSGFNFESLSISVNSTDSYTWKILTPAYATNPTLWIGNLMARLLY